LYHQKGLSLILRVDDDYPTVNNMSIHSPEQLRLRIVNVKSRHPATKRFGA
jgi:hypothetical protein